MSSQDQCALETKSVLKLTSGLNVEERQESWSVVYLVLQCRTKSWSHCIRRNCKPVKCNVFSIMLFVWSRRIRFKDVSCSIQRYVILASEMSLKWQREKKQQKYKPSHIEMSWSSWLKVCWHRCSLAAGRVIKSCSSIKCCAQWYQAADHVIFTACIESWSHITVHLHKAAQLGQ